MDSVLVTSYVNPDLDGYACAFAYAELLQKTHVDAKAGISGTPHQEARWVVNTFGMKELAQINPEQYSTIVLVDTSEPTNLDPRIILSQVVEIIDHRTVHQLEKFKNAKVQLELVGAAATLIAERFQKARITPSKETAILLHAAIISNTLNFKSPLTTTRDTEMIQWLHEYSHLPQTFAHDMFTAKSDLSGERLLEQMVGDLSAKVVAAKSIAIAQLEIVSAEQLLKERFADILEIMRTLKEEASYDFILLNIIDLEHGYNVFVSEDSTELLTQALGLTFHKHIARTDELLMRKQIWPKLKEFLEITK